LRVRDVQERDILSREKRVVAAMEHEAGKVAHDGLRLKVKIAKHFIRAPATDEADDVSINVSKEKGHRPSSSKGLRSDIRGKKANTGA
jgi:hypothetical protein